MLIMPEHFLRQSILNNHVVFGPKNDLHHDYYRGDYPYNFRFFQWFLTFDIHNPEYQRVEKPSI